MRTNKLFLAAAALAAGVLGASAQSNVYSLNIVGYINIPLTAGKVKMVANQLKATPDNKLASVVVNPPGGTEISQFNPAGGFNVDAFNDGAWDSTGNMDVSPGKGFFIKSPVDTTITLVGEVILSSTNQITTLLDQKSSILPQAGTLAALGFPIADGLEITTWSATSQSFTPYLFTDGAWDGGNEPTIAVGESFYAKSAVAAPWVRNFTP